MTVSTNYGIILFPTVKTPAAIPETDIQAAKVGETGSPLPASGGNDILDIRGSVEGTATWTVACTFYGPALSGRVIETRRTVTRQAALSGSLGTTATQNGHASHPSAVQGLARYLQDRVMTRLQAGAAAFSASAIAALQAQALQPTHALQDSPSSSEPASVMNETMRAQMSVQVSVQTRESSSSCPNVQISPEGSGSETGTISTGTETRTLLTDQF
ncbi:hypothetical protein [Gluconobacter morbifer]|nr:hypothetical protein [Gluconobacter morbifer]